MSVEHSKIPCAPIMLRYLPFFRNSSVFFKALIFFFSNVILFQKVFKVMSLSVRFYFWLSYIPNLLSVKNTLLFFFTTLTVLLRFSIS